MKDNFIDTVESLKKILDVIEDSRRMTGRTTRMLETCESGDALVFHKMGMPFTLKDGVRKLSASSLKSLEDALRASSYNNIYLDNGTDYVIIKKELDNLIYKYRHIKKTHTQPS